MTKVSRKYIDPKDLGLYVNNLWDAFTLADSKNDIRLLFKDLFTHTEYKMFAKRFEIARRLLSGSTYEEIQRSLGVTSGTVTVINNILAEKGQGYRKAHKQLTSSEEKKAAKQRDYFKNLENPFRSKLHRKTLLGKVISGGVIELDKKIIKVQKQRTIKKSLDI